MTTVIHHDAMRQRIRQRYSPPELDALTELLTDSGTLHFARLSTGLFPAAGANSAVIQGGYNNVWVRDNIYVALAHAGAGRHDVTRGILDALAGFYRGHRARLEAIVLGKVDPGAIMHRPHVRFDGQTLAELPTHWAHAQNDALGYFLWLYCREALTGRLQPDVQLLALFALYFAAIRYWQDEDSGHWEERRKIGASSVGAVVAGLRTLRRLLAQPTPPDCRFAGEQVTPDTLDALIEPGMRALAATLPAECVQPDPRKYRRYDAALLFLVYPLDVVEDVMAQQIVADVLAHLQGDYGIRRYLGDSYWTADYKDKLPPETRTIDVSEHQETRDALARPGEEAQWCVFDPIVSIIAGRRYRRTGEAADLDRQVHHFNRALGQLTGTDCPQGALRCPEAYYLEHGRYVPNDHVPLLWTQANLWLALLAMRSSVAAAA
jgi:phosphorylase kinase alpha/beta subunit